MKATVCRRAHFNAAHRLHHQAWDAQKNKDVFGKCNNPNFHGHNYELIVKVKGEIHPDTGFVIELNNLKQIIKEEVEDRFDHKNLNLDVEDFKNLNPTVENIAMIIWGRLRTRLDESLELGLVLYETHRNYVEFGQI